MTSFKVQAEDLTAHASHLDGLTDRVDTALSAAQTVSMSDEAYGLLCSFLPPIVNPMEEEGINALKAAKEGITVTADNVRSSAKDYQETDDANSDELKKFDEAVEVKQSAVALRGVPAVDSGGGSPQQLGAPMAEPQQQGTPVAEPQRQGTPVAEPQHEAVRSAERGTPLAEPMQQATAMREQQHGVTPAQQGTPLAEPMQQGVRPAEQATSLAEPMQQGVRPAEQATPVAEPMQQGVSPQQQAVSPVMRGELQEEPLRPTERGTPA